jgi:DNA-binding NarL/FixJ family response regulator
MTPLRVLLVDDQAFFREAVHTLLSLNPDFEVVGEAANGEEAILQADLLSPDVVLMDLRMPLLNGVEATRRIRLAHPASQVIVLTTFEDDAEVFDAVRAGAVGYLLKDVPGSRLMEAIRSAARGESVLHPSVAAKVLNEFNRLSQPRATPSSEQLKLLSQRELEVLRELANGKSNKEIGAALHLAEGTVKNHMSHLLNKLGVLDRTQAALRAREMGLI